jgi:hypothetical protein
MNETPLEVRRWKIPEEVSPAEVSPVEGPQ